VFAQRAEPVKKKCKYVLGFYCVRFHVILGLAGMFTSSRLFVFLVWCRVLISWWRCDSQFMYTGTGADYFVLWCSG